MRARGAAACRCSAVEIPDGPPPTMATSHVGGAADSTRPSTISRLSQRGPARAIRSLVAKEHVAAWCGARLLSGIPTTRKDGRNEDLQGHHPHPPADEGPGREDRDAHGL